MNFVCHASACARHLGFRSPEGATDFMDDGTAWGGPTWRGRYRHEKKKTINLEYAKHKKKKKKKKKKNPKP